MVWLWDLAGLREERCMFINSEENRRFVSGLVRTRVMLYHYSHKVVCSFEGLWETIAYEVSDL